MHGRETGAAEPLVPNRWRENEEYLFAVDLFNHGYYWESHEAWESLWHAAGRRGPIAIWLKALIKLAAAAVKLREGNSHGVERHARRTVELLAELETASSPDQAWSGLVVGDGGGGVACCGIDVGAVRAIANALIAEARIGLRAAPTRVLDGWLDLRI
jgi:hypothetical protein